MGPIYILCIVLLSPPCKYTGVFFAFSFLCLFLDLQNVDITLRILFRPDEKSLPWIFTHVGVDFDEKILPSITNEVLKGVVVSV